MKTTERTTERKSDTRLDLVHRQVELVGLADAMFDRYAGDNKTQLAWWQKIYLVPGTSDLCIPTTNIVSFLSAHNTNSAPKRLRDKRKYKDIANACLSFVHITGDADSPTNVRFLRDGKPIQVGKFSEDRDELSGVYRHFSVARLDKGIPNPKERPTLPLPWSVRFTLSIYPNQEIKEQEVMNLFAEGGIAIGLGTFRGVFGKFRIWTWE